MNLNTCRKDKSDVNMLVAVSKSYLFAFQNTITTILPINNISEDHTFEYFTRLK